GAYGLGWPGSAPVPSASRRDPGRPPESRRRDAAGSASSSRSFPPGPGPWRARRSTAARDVGSAPRRHLNVPRSSSPQTAGYTLREQTSSWFVSQVLYVQTFLTPGSHDDANPDPGG